MIDKPKNVAKEKREKKEKKTTNEKPISLYPLSKEAALRKFLQTNPSKKKSHKGQ